MDESRKAFRQWLIDRESLPIPNTINEYLLAAWQAAVEWARKDERERLAKLAHERGHLREDEILDIAKGWK